MGVLQEPRELEVLGTKGDELDVLILVTFREAGHLAAVTNGDPTLPPKTFRGTLDEAVLPLPPR